MKNWDSLVLLRENTYLLPALSHSLFRSFEVNLVPTVRLFPHPQLTLFRIPAIFGHTLGLMEQWNAR